MPAMNYRKWLNVLVLTALLPGCGKEADKKDEKKEPAKEASSEKAPASESRVKHGPNGEVTVTVETNLQQTMGLQTATLEPAQASPEVKGYGQVLDPSGLASLAGELATAEAAQQASDA